MIYDSIIPTYEKDRDCVDPTNTWMLPFVTPGLRADTLFATDPSITPILTTVDVGVCWWHRWAQLNLRLFDLGSAFGTQDIPLIRYEAPYIGGGPNTEVIHHSQLAKPESYIFHGERTIELSYPGPPAFTDTVIVSADVNILPPKGTTYGDEVGMAEVVDESYTIQEGMTPNVCGLLPVVIITISIQMDAGFEVVNVLTNYGPADDVFSAEFGGVYGGIIGSVINPFPITLNNMNNGTSVFLPGTAFAAKIWPIAWFPWNDTWDDETGERL